MLLCLLTLTPAKAHHIAVLTSQNIEPFHQAFAGFASACSDHIIEHITEYASLGSPGAKTVVIKRLKAATPALVLAIGAQAAQVAKDALPDTPLIFFMVHNPRQYRLQGDRITGISLDIPIATQLAVYQSLVPNLQTIGVIYDPKKMGPMVAEAAVVAETLGFQLLTAGVASQKAVPAALRSMLGEIDALWMLPDDTVVTPESFKFLLLETLKNHLPFLAAFDIFVGAGALGALSPDYTDVGRRACQLARGIESGRLNQAEVDILHPARVNLAINLKTASQIGLTFPVKIVQSASIVYR